MVDLARHQNTRLFFPKGVKQKKFAFLYAVEEADKDNVSLDETWGKGFYAFFSTLPDNASAFGQRLHDLFKRIPGDVRFGWLGERSSNFDFKISARKVDAKCAALIREEEFDLANTTVYLEADCRVCLPTNAASLTFQVIKSADGGAAPYLRISPDTGAPAETYLSGGLELPFGEDTAGQLSYQVLLDSEALEKLDVGFRYFHPEDADVVTSVRYPIFKTATPRATVPVTITRNVLAQESLGSASITFGGAGQTSRNESPITLGSHFSTHLGHGIDLVPISRSKGAGARLVLAYRPEYLGNPHSTRRYLVPEGDFEVRIRAGRGETRDPRGHRLICGLSGSEYLSIKNGDVLSFEPGYPSFIHPTSRQAAAGPEQPLLSDLTQTAWVKVKYSKGRAGGPAEGYFAQPEDASLFEPQGEARDGRAKPNEYLKFRELPPRNFPALPMVTYGGLPTGDTEKARALEAETLSPARRMEVGKLKAADSAPAGDFPLEAVTPQGLLAEFDEKGMSRLFLAKTPKGRLYISRPSSELRTALESNRLFLVATKVGSLGVEFKSEVTTGNLNAGISISDWGFDLNPTIGAGVPLAARPIIIFKFFDRPLGELLDDSRVWASPGSFVDHKPDDPTGAAAVEDLRLHLKKVVGAVPKPGDPAADLYRQFAEAVGDAGWNGIIALNCGISPQALPKQVKCLLAGIEVGRFRAHHVGIKVNDVKMYPEGTPEDPKRKLAITNSSLFGLINYPDEAAGPNSERGGDDYDFKVKRLAVLFINSEIQRFDSEVSLKVNKLFSEHMNLPQARRPGRRAAPAPAAAADNVIEFKGHYERHNGEDVYTFIHEREYQFTPKQSWVFKNIAVQKIQLYTSKFERAAGGDEKLTARFSLWGNICFKEPEALQALDIFSFKKLQFVDLGLVMDILLPAVGDSKLGALRFDPGDIRFDLALSEKRKEGLFKNFPLKLSGFTFSTGGARLSELGYFQIGGGGQTFTFGLLSELDLGSLGALSSKFKDLRADLLFGWNPNQKEFAFGFSLRGLSGGKLDLGVEGVIRLTADSLSFLKEKVGSPERTIFGIRLLGSSVEILGKRLPAAPGKLNILLFADPKDIANRELGKVGWFIGYLPGKGSGSTGFLKLNYLGLGQHIKPTGDVSTFQKILTSLKALPAQKGDEEMKYDNLPAFAPERQWIFATEFDLLETLHLGVVFNDPALYSFFVKHDAPDFSFEITYRKVSDEVGVYYVDISLPIPPIEVGAASVTLPSVAISIYTNGGYKIDLGFPSNLDFSRSFQVQALPFTGAGGFYFASLKGGVSDLMPGTNALTVLEAGFGMRVGVGKTFAFGPFKGGISATIYGIIEGAVGFGERAHDGQPQQPVKFDKPTDYFLQGQYGVMAEIYGVANYGLMKATVLIRIWAGIGARLRKGQDFVLWVEAGIEVYVEIVVARIRAWLVNVEVKVSFSFRGRVREEWVVGGGTRSERLLLARDEAVLDWKTGYQHFPTKPELPVYFLPEITFKEKRLYGVALLAVEISLEKEDPKLGTKPFDLLAAALLGWTFKRFLEFKAGRPVKDPLAEEVRAADLEHLNALLSKPVSLARSDTRNPLDAEHLATFLAENFKVVVRSVPNKLNAGAFPMLTDLGLRAFADNTPTGTDIKFWMPETKYDETYQDFVSGYFQELFANFESQVPQLSGERTAPTPRSGVAILFQDYFDLIIKAGVNQLWGYLRQSGAEKVRVDALLKSEEALKIYANLGGMVTRFLKHGLQVPSPKGEMKPLYDFTTQQFKLKVPERYTEYRVELYRNPETTWFEADSPTMKLANDAIKNLEETISNVKPELAVPVTRVPYLKKNPRTYPLQHSIRWQKSVKGRTRAPFPVQRSEGRAVQPVFAAENWEILPFPASLDEQLAASAAEGLELVLKECTLGKNCPWEQSRVLNRDAAPDWRWATRVELTLRRVAVMPTGNVSGAAGEGAYLKNVYHLGGADEANRRLLKMILNRPPAELKGLEVSLLYQPKQRRDPGGPGLVSDVIELSDVILIKTNLSTETRPREGLLRGNELAPVEEFDGHLGQPQRFLELVWECSVVNTGGYYLHYRTTAGAGLDIFDGDTGSDKGIGRVTLLVTMPAQPKALPCHNAIALHRTPATPRAGGEGEKVVYLEAPGLYDHEVSIRPGYFAFRVDRKNPGARHRLPTALRQGSAHEAGLTRAQVLEAMRARGLDPDADTEETRESLRDTGEVEVEVEKLYNLLVYKVVADAAQGIVGSKESLPLGHVLLDPDEDKRPAPFGLNEQLGLLEERHWRYQQLVPLYKFVQENQKNPDPSPYAVVGKTFTLEFSLRDVFGNKLSGWTRLHTFEQPFKYFDNLIPISEWRAVKVSYRFAPRDKVVVTLCCDPADFDKLSDEERALTLQHYRTIRHQVLGPGVTVSFETSLTPESNPAKPLYPVRPDDLNGFLTTIIDYLKTKSLPPTRRRGVKIRSERGRVAAISRQFVLTLTAQNLSAQKKDIFPLTVDFRVQRNPDLVDKEVKESAKLGHTRAYDVRTALTPDLAPPANSDPCDERARKELGSLKHLAEAFESCFPDPSTKRGAFKLAAGEGRGGESSLWAVRRRLLTVNWNKRDYRYPYYFAPRPILNNLWSSPTEQDVQVPIYQDDGQPVIEMTRFVNIDLDVYARAFLDAVERFLSPEMAAAVRRLSPGEFAAVMLAKRQLACHLSKLVTPLFRWKNGIPHAGDERAAREVFRQRLLSNLVSAYEVDSVVQYPVEVAPGFEGAGPRLFGNIRRSEAQAAPLDAVKEKVEYAFSAAKVPLGGTFAGRRRGLSTLTFLFDSKIEKERSAFKLNLTYEVTHIEHNIGDGGLAPASEGPEADDCPREEYVPSSWLYLVNSEPFVFEQTALPVPLREYPEQPTLLKHYWGAGTPADGSPLTPACKARNIADARRWSYGFQYEQAPVSQDQIVVEVEYNAGAKPGLRAAVDDSLPEALAVFHRNYFPRTVAGGDEATLPGLAEKLRRIPEAAALLDTDKENEKITRARTLIKVFGLLVARVAEATWKRGQSPAAAAAAGLTSYTNTYDIKEPPPASPPSAPRRGRAPEPPERTVSVNFRKEGEQTTPNASLLRVWPRENGEDNEKNYKIVVQPGASGSSWNIRYRCAAQPPTDSLRREVVVGNLDVLSVENAWAGIHLVRNRDLLDAVNTSEYPIGDDLLVNPAFIYETPRVRFVDALTPTIDCGEWIDIARLLPGQPQSAPLREYLVKLLEELFRQVRGGGRTDGDEYRLQIECKYGFDLRGAGTAISPGKERLIPQVKFRLRTAFNLSPGGFGPLADELVAEFLEWNRAYGPSKDGLLVFDVLVFAKLTGGNRPVLRLRNLWLALSKVRELGRGGRDPQPSDKRGRTGSGRKRKGS